MTAVITELFAFLGVVGDWLGTVGSFMARDVTDVGLNVAGDPAGPAEGYSDFFDGILVMIGTSGSGLGEVIAALGTYLGTLN